MSDPGDNGVEYLYETPDTGTLSIGDDGKARRTHQDDPQSSFKASLTGTTPRYGYQGQKGLGGSEVSVSAAPVKAAMEPAKVELTPEQLMQWADNEEKKIASDRLDKSTAVDPTLLRTGYPGGDAPEWLQQYMARQPIAGESQMPMGGVDRFQDQKYLSEKRYREQLKKLRDQKPGR